MFGSFLPNLWSSCNQSVRSREPTLLCNQVPCVKMPVGVSFQALITFRSIDSRSAPIEDNQAKVVCSFHQKREHFIHSGINDAQHGCTMAKVIPQRPVTPDAVIHIFVAQGADTWILPCQAVV